MQGIHSSSSRNYDFMNMPRPTRHRIQLKGKKWEEVLDGDGFIDEVSGNPGRLGATGWE